MSASDRAVKALGEAEYGLLSALRMFSAINDHEPRKDLVKMIQKTSERLAIVRTALAALEEELHLLPQLRAELETEKALRIEDIEDQIILQRKIDALEEERQEGERIEGWVGADEDGERPFRTAEWFDGQGLDPEPQHETRATLIIHPATEEGDE